MTTQTNDNMCEWALVAVKRCDCGACCYDVPSHEWQGSVREDGAHKFCDQCDNRLSSDGRSWRHA